MITKLITISNEEYKIVEDKVFDKETNQEIPVYLLKDGQRIILVKGVKFNYGVVKLVAYGKCNLPEKYWKGCKVWFHDDNTENYHVSNIYIIFPKGGIESEEIKGFRYIPGFELNLINREGVVYDTITEAFKPFKPSNQLVNENKRYYRVSVRVTHRRITSQRHHRLMALAFCDPPKGYTKLVTDHLNTIKTDNRPENLEWVTYQENSDRAVDMGLYPSAIEIEVMDKLTGEITEYRSLKQMHQLTGFGYGSLCLARARPSKTYRNRYIIRDKGDETPWEVYKELGKVKGFGPVKGRCVYTGAIKNFDSVKAAEIEVDVSEKAITRCFTTRKAPTIVGGYEWKLKGDTTPWYEFNEYDLEKYRRGMNSASKVYELVDLKTGTKHICYGWWEASAITGVGHRNTLKAVEEEIVMKGRYTIRTVSTT